MKRFLSHIKLILLLLLIVLVSGFASLRHRNKAFSETGLRVEFTNGDNLFITKDSVNKMLIQKLRGLDNQRVESLFLNGLEKFVNENDMIKNAEVYHELTGDIGVVVTQRTPVLRVVNGAEAFYIDDEGKRMPLSANYSARVPVFYGTISDTASLVELSNYIANNEFLKKQVIGIEQKGNDKHQIFLHTRLGDHIVVWGNTNRMKEKELKLKAFYQKALKDKLLDRYDTINLKFKNQVVCSKNKTWNKKI